MHRKELKDFIKKHRKLGTLDESIREILIDEGGWSEAEVESVFSELDFGVSSASGEVRLEGMPTKPELTKRNNGNTGLYERLERKAKEKPGYVSFSS